MLMIHHTQWVNVQHVKGLHAAPVRPGSRQPVRYEGYGPGEAALLIDCLTDDPERTRTRLKDSLREHGGYLGAAGSVAYLFDYVGLLRYAPQTDAQGLIQTALLAGAEEVIGRPAAIEVLTDPQDFESIHAELRRRGFAPLTAELTEHAALSAHLSGEAAQRLVQLIEALAMLDEVCHVYTNAELVGEHRAAAGHGQS